MGCAACGTPIEEDDRFCTGCGRAVEDMAEMTVPRMNISRGAPPPAAAVPPPTFVEEEPAPDETDGGRRRWLLPAVGGVVVLGLGVAAFVVVAGGDDDAATSDGGNSLVTVPESVERQWRERFDGWVATRATSSSVFVLDGSNELIALSIDDGQERWSEDLRSDFATLEGVYGDVVIARVSEDSFDDPAPEYVALQVSDGEERWRLDADDTYLLSLDGRVFLSEEGSSSERLTALDPATGETGDRVRGDVIQVVRDHFIVWDDDEIEVFDRELRSVLGPVRIDVDTSAVALEDGQLLVAVDDEIMLLDDEGEPKRITDVPYDRVNGMRVEGDLLIIDAEGEVSVIRPVDGRAEELWSEDGFLQGVARGGSEPVVLVQNEEDLDGYTLRDGKRVLSTAGSVSAFGSNAILVNRDVSGSSETEAIDLRSGDSLWEIDGWATLVDGAVIAREVRNDRTELTVYR